MRASSSSFDVEKRYALGAAPRFAPHITRFSYDNGTETSTMLTPQRVAVLLLCLFAFPLYATSDLLISVDVRTTTAVQGGGISYYVGMANYGPDDATQVVLTDVLPPQLLFDDLHAEAGWACTTPARGTNGTIACTRDTWPGAAHGTSANFILSTRVAFDASGTVVNTASVSQAGTDPTPENATASAAPVTITGTTADVSIAKEVSTATVPAGTALTYTITMTNNGPDAASQVTMTDVLPEPLYFLSRFVSTTPVPADFHCTVPEVGKNGTVTCTAFSMGAGVTATLSLHVGVAPGAAFGTVTNTATIVAETQDPDTDDHSSSATVQIAPGADLSIRKSTATTTAPAGSTFEYLLSVQNSGPNDATNVVMTDVLPRQLLFERIQGPTMFSCATPPAGTSGTITCTAPVFQAARAGAFTLRVRVADGASATVTNEATVSSSTADMNPSNDTAAATPVTLETRLEPGAAGLPQMTPQVATTWENALAVWREGEVRFGPAGEPASIRGALFRPGSGASNVVVFAGPDRESNTGYPAVAAAVDRYLVVWREIAESRARVLARRLHADGSFVDAHPLVLGEGPATECCEGIADPLPAVASDGSAFYVAWVTPTEVRGISVPADGPVAGEPAILSRDADPRRRDHHDLHVAWTSAIYVVVWMDRIVEGPAPSPLAIRYARVTAQGVLLDAETNARISVPSLSSITVAPVRGGAVVGIDPIQPTVPPPPSHALCPSVLVLTANGDRDGSARSLACDPYSGYAPILQSQLLPLPRGFLFVQPGGPADMGLEEMALRPYGIDPALSTLANPTELGVLALEVTVASWRGSALFVYNHAVPTGATTSVPRLFTYLLTQGGSSRGRVVRH
jgi:uncharacterized repeat protein (TIGR01451 family)